MFSTLRRIITELDLEEKILNAGAFLGMIGVLFPWMGGQWLGGASVMHTGFGFYTSFLGLAVFLLNGFILFVTLSPLMGGPAILRREQCNIARLLAGGQSLVLTIAALSVLTRVAFEFSRVEIRFGIYMSMIGSLTASLYAFLKFQEEQRRTVQSFFHHDEPVTEKRNIVPVTEVTYRERRAVIERIKTDAVRSDPAEPLPIKEEVHVSPSISTVPVIPHETPTIPNAPKVEEHPIFRGL